MNKFETLGRAFDIIDKELQSFNIQDGKVTFKSWNDETITIAPSFNPPDLSIELRDSGGMLLSGFILDTETKARSFLYSKILNFISMAYGFSTLKELEENDLDYLLDDLLADGLGPITLSEGFSEISSNLKRLGKKFLETFGF